MSKLPLIDTDGEVRELDAEDMALFRPMSDVVPLSLQTKLKGIGQRGSQKLPTKVQVTLRLSPEVDDYFRATGKGWQSRIDRALKDYVASQ